MIFNVGQGSGSGKLVHLNISYDASLAGATITATNGSEVHTAEANESGLTVISGKSLGEWTITESMFSTSAVVNTTFYGNYNAGLGGNIKITVSFESAFTGKTLTLTNGSKTYTRVATGSSVLFVVADTGTWTVSGEVDGQTYSSSINITEDGEYNMSLATEVTLNLTVYSAANDTVYYYPNNDTGRTSVTLCTTNASGLGSGTITVVPDTEIVFYSTIAKDTTDGTGAYSKAITLTSGLSEIKVMPENALYWFGYIKNYVKALALKPVGATAYTVMSPSLTLNTNSFYAKQPNSSGSIYGIVSVGGVVQDGFTKVKYNVSGKTDTSNNSLRFRIIDTDESNFNDSVQAGVLNKNCTSYEGILEGDISTIEQGNSMYPSVNFQIFTATITATTVYAIWFE